MTFQRRDISALSLDKLTTQILKSMRPNKYLKYTAFAFCLASATSFVGCYDYEVPEGWGKDQLSEEFVLTLTIGSGNDHHSRALSRIRPEGGEDGDGRELGQHKENDIENLVLYYYSDPAGINATDAPITKILYKSDVAYRPDITGKPTNTELLEYQLKFSAAETHYDFHAGDHFIVVANMGDVNCSTLSELRDKLVEKAWTVPGSATCKGDYELFVMSNERESVTTKGTGSEANPHKITVTIERVAARLDFCTDNAASTAGSPTIVPATAEIEYGKPALIYNVEDKSANVGTLYLTHVRAFNVMEEPAYLIKRCATPEDPTKVTFLKNETEYTTGDFSEFPIVTEQHTWVKPIDGSLPDYSSWYGASYFPNITKDTWFTTTDGVTPTDVYRVHNTNASDGFSANGISTNGDAFCKNYYVLDYANENTMQAAASTSHTATGLLLRGIFQPASVYSTASPLTLSTTYRAGASFYRYRPLTTEYDETQAVYFDNLAAANAYKALQTDKPGIVETYLHGLCYYPVYLRHDHGDDASPFRTEVTPMEFATVRNNIYRLKCSFTGPGYNVIPPTPSFEPLGIKPYIYVRRWYQITHPEIEI